MQCVGVFLDTANLLISRVKMLMSAEPKGCVTWFIYFLDLLWGQVSSLWGMCDIFYGCGPFLHLPPSVNSPEKANLNRVNRISKSLLALVVYLTCCIWVKVKIFLLKFWSSYICLKKYTHSNVWSSRWITLGSPN